MKHAFSHPLCRIALHPWRDVRVDLPRHEGAGMVQAVASIDSEGRCGTPKYDSRSDRDADEFPVEVVRNIPGAPAGLLDGVVQSGDHEGTPGRTQGPWFGRPLRFEEQEAGRADGYVVDVHFGAKPEAVDESPSTTE